ncbi:hypothetical protein J32TS2_40580 [Shouchella clausii]|nr:hypothetical protein J32TS2_40580 [Shouchella clausii]
MCWRKWKRAWAKAHWVIMPIVHKRATPFYNLFASLRNCPWNGEQYPFFVYSIVLIPNTNWKLTTDKEEMA